MRNLTALACSLLVLTAVACSRSDAQQGSGVVPVKLGHHEIRADRLPQPYDTPSAGNPPRNVRRPSGFLPTVPAGFKVSIWADDISDPRNMVLAPNGDIFVASTGEGEIVGFRDTNGDHVPDERFTYADDLNEPFGLAFRGPHLYVGNTDAVVRFDYTSGDKEARGQPATITPLPPGGHSTRNVIFNRDATKMYVAVGSRSNVDNESDDPMRAAITEYNPDGSGRRTFASGLRNPVGLAWNPANNTLWTSVNERDGLGDDLVPDYITEVKRDGFYGWPFSYIGKNEDPRRKGEKPDLVAKAIPPSLLIQAHSAALGLIFYQGTMFPEKYRGGAFVALHGSWNRSDRTGYKVIHVPMKNGQPTGGYDDFAAGWSPRPGATQVYGRPVGLLVLRDGSLLISDDGTGVIWRVTTG